MRRESLGPEYESCDWLKCEWKSTKWENLNLERWKLKVGSPLTEEFIYDLTSTRVLRIDSGSSDLMDFHEYCGGVLSVELDNTITITLVIKPGTVKMPDEEPDSDYDEDSDELKVGSPLTSSFIHDLTYTKVDRLERDDANAELRVILKNSVFIHLCHKSVASSNGP